MEWRVQQLLDFDERQQSGTGARSYAAPAHQPQDLIAFRVFAWTGAKESLQEQSALPACSKGTARFTAAALDRFA